MAWRPAFAYAQHTHRPGIRQRDVSGNYKRGEIQPHHVRQA